MRNVSLGVLCSIGVAGTLVLAACGSKASTGGTGTSGTTGNSSSAGAAATTTTTTTSAGSGNASKCTAGSALGTVSGWVELCLPYNQMVFGITGTAVAPGFDGGGYDLDPTDPAWPKESKTQCATTGVQTTASSVPFWFPPTGCATTSVKNSLDLGPNGGPATINVPAGSYKQMAILGSAGNGGSNPPNQVDIQFNYSSGSPDKTTVYLEDWCSSSPTGQPGFMPADRYQNGAQTGPACGVFVYPIPIPGSSKTLKSIALSNDPGSSSNYEPEVMALSLQKG